MSATSPSSVDLEKITSYMVKVPQNLKSGGLLSTQPKDCQSECCKASTSTSSTPAPTITKTKMMRGKLVFSRQPVDTICRVDSCRLYGKAIKNFQQHIQEEHQLTYAQHRELPPASLRQQYIATKTNSSWMKYRKPELCFVPGCSFQHNVYLSELVKHLRHEHKMAREEYRTLIKTLSLQDFDGHCPAMIEEVEESAMEQADKILGKVHHRMHMTLEEEDKCYPTVRLVKIAMVPDGVKVFSFKEREIIPIHEEENTGQGKVTLLGRKRLMSEEHKIAFSRSLMSSDPWLFPKDFSWIRYKCAICQHVHVLDIVFVDQKNFPLGI